MRFGLVSGDNDARALRLGFRLIHGLSEKHAEAVVRARRDGPFRSFAEFVARTGLRAAALKRLSAADAFGSLGMDRQSTLWRALPERGPVTEFDRIDTADEPAPLPRLVPFEEVLADYRTTGLTLRQHPVSFLRPALEKIGVTPAERLSGLKNDIRLSVAGLVLCRQRPSTASGVTFVTLEDETGIVNLIVHRAVWERYRRVARTATAMVVHGRLQVEAEVIHVLASRLEDLTERLSALSVKSRDFH